MKLKPLRFRHGNRSGIILLVILWMMALLSILAIGLGRRTSIDLSLTKYAVGKLRADYFTWAGFMYAIDQLKKDAEDTQTSRMDSLYECGITLNEGQTPEDLFKNVAVEQGFFDVNYISQGGSETLREVRFGLEDQERKININAITQQNYKVLSHLIFFLGFDNDTAETIASSVADWRDSDSTVTSPPFGAEDSYYKDLPKPYPCKNSFFESKEELLLVKGVTQEIFSKIKDYVTIFPQESPLLLVNMNTAPEIVIRAAARSLAGPITNTEIGDADSMAAKIISYRRGEDGKEGTRDDRRIDMNALGLNEKEQIIFLAMKSQTTDVSHYFRIRVRGEDKLSAVHSDVEAIVFRDDLTVVSWHRD